MKKTQTHNSEMGEGEEDCRTIPAIDLKKFPEAEEYRKLREASETWGCFRLVNHMIPPALMSEMKSVVRSLLDLPMEIKKQNKDVIAGSGYMAPSKVNPLYEALGLYDLGSGQAVDSFCSQLNASSYQREVIEKYAQAVYEQIVDIGQRLAKSLGLADSDYLKGWPCQFRINKYNFTPESVGSSGVQLHTDSGFLTILQDDEGVGGLEVMDKSGAFVAVDPCPGTLLVNLGDVAKAWSNGRLCNVKHKVQCKEATIRISIATFLLGPKKEAIVEAPAEFVDSEHPRLYVPFTYEDYRKLRLSTKLQAGEALALMRTPS
ncbi:2-oxoglutarate-dependent dioxygenase DAO-like [Pyrus ussuriensis x Pyrus communis]|uniref:2-oxoglutarate-dependent dioxygenase DAO n=1 Tax=Pyrus ussuriensis x Pyrus communis TaxID=2448454 RepID=A0A5N5I213_9ROSA|nr:2-oxoglutarate-dependent dioxygenase DAO-like [Pyrus ussuriensis x Pyrus communis]